MEQFDAIVIGGGQAGNPLSHNLADRGWTVALIEREHLGGSCVNYGCTPTKAMIASAQIVHEARRGAEMGVHTGPVEVNLPEIVARKNELVAQWRSGQVEHATSRETLELIRGEARFTGPKTVAVGERELTAGHIFINTGTSALVLPIDGIHGVAYLTNKNVMDLEEVPEHLLIIGGSYIGLEFGQMYRRFGAQVTVIEFEERIISQEDAEVSAAVQEILEEEGLSFLLGAKASRVEQADDGSLLLTVESQADGSSRVLGGSHLLLAAGRTPNTDALNLQAAGIETEKGWIVTDEYLQTNVEGVYALGDVKGGPAFTHISYNDFQIVYHNLTKAEDEPKKSIEDRLLSYALFTDPELGRVGLSERQAKERGYRLKVGSIPMAWVARAIERGDTRGLMKVVIDADTDRILGAAMLGHGGGELVQVIQAAMWADAPASVFYQSIYIHPTMTEGFFSLFDNVE